MYNFTAFYNIEFKRTSVIFKSLYSEIICYYKGCSSKGTDDWSFKSTKKEEFLNYFKSVYTGNNLEVGFSAFYALLTDSFIFILSLASQF